LKLSQLGKYSNPLAPWLTPESFSFKIITTLIPEESTISISKITDILLVLLLSIVICVLVFAYLGDQSYYMILATVLIILADIIYIVLKIMRKPPPSEPPELQQ
jgi:hypothetical protein